MNEKWVNAPTPEFPEIEQAQALLTALAAERIK
jgi:hypothetical protein